MRTLEELATAAAGGDQEALSELAEGTQGLVRRLALGESTKFPGGRWIDEGDLTGWGWLGFLDAARLWRSDAGSGWVNWAAVKIRGRMIEELRRATRARVAKKLGDAAPRFCYLAALNDRDGEHRASWEPADPSWTREAIDDDIDGRSPEAEGARWRLRRVLRQLVGAEALEVLILHRVVGLRLREIGEQFGYSESNAGLVERKAKERLREVLLG